MADQSGQTFVTIKKPDGTTERVTLAQLRARQSSRASGVTDVAPQMSKLASKSIAADFKDPLETPMVRPGAPSVSPSREGAVEKIIAGLSFEVAAPYLNRLRSLIQLRLKDVRSEEETRAVAIRSIKDGGLGITESQSQELVRALQGARPSSPGPVNKPETRGPAPKTTTNSSLPMVEPPLPAAKSTPFNAFVHGPVPQFPKRQINDIIPPPKEMGPLDEIKYFTLTDFRRLSDDPREAAARLWQKFINLKEESILLYFDAVKYWYFSPLCKSYLDLICSSLGSRKKITELIRDKSGIQLAEIEALIEMQKKME